MNGLSTLEEFEPGKKTGPTRLLIAVLLASLAHLLVLTLIRFDLPTVSLPKVLEITLLPKVVPVRNSEVPEERIEPVPVPVEPVKRTTPAQVLNSETTATAEEPEQVAPRERGAILLQRALRSVRDGALPTAPREKRFQVTDGLAPEPENTDFTAPIDVLPVMVSQPGEKVIYDNMGYAMTRKTDGFGGVRCLQERGDWSDAGIKWKGVADKWRNPPLTYLVPEANCGHLE